MNVHQRILQVIAAAGAARKTGRASYGDQYAFHKIDDIVDHLREHLVEAGLIYAPVVREFSGWDRDVERIGSDGKVRQVTQACLRTVLAVRFINIEDPTDCLVVEGVGLGMDDQDKSDGKGYSYALKTALLALFQLRGQPDVEDTDHGSAKATRKPDSGTRAKAASPNAVRDALVGDIGKLLREHPQLREAVATVTAGLGLTSLREEGSVEQLRQALKELRELA